MESVRALPEPPASPSLLSAAEVENAHTAKRILVGALGIGVLGDQLLRAGPIGIGGAIWMLFVIGTLASLTSADTARALWQRRLLLGISSALALMLIVRDEGPMSALLVLSLFAIAGLTVAIFRGEMIDDLLDLPVIHTALAAARAYISGAIGAILLMLRDVRSENLSPVRRSHRSALIRGTIITVPVVAVFIALFASADPTFEALTEALRIDIDELLGHVVMTGILTWIAAGVLRHAALGPDTQLARTREIEALGAVEVGMLLGTMTVVFTIFVALQLPRMFAGEEYIIRETGLTYAGYARRGFFELVVASGLTLAVIAGLRSVVRADDRARKLLRMLGGVLVALVFVILQSAIHRLALYVDAYGWTEDRIYAIAIIAWLGICFAISFATLLGTRPERFVGGAFAAAVAVVFGLVAINPQATIVKLNADRARSGRPFDFAYLGQLGRDAAPAFAKELRRLPVSAPLTADDCAGLSRYLYRLDQSPEWRAWTISAWRAGRVAPAIETWRAQHCSRGIKPSLKRRARRA